MKGELQRCTGVPGHGQKAQPGTRLRGDLGVLRGNGTQTLQRVYWTNKATAIVADISKVLSD